MDKNKLYCSTCGAECPIHNADKRMKTQYPLTWRELHSSPPHKIEVNT